MRRCVAVCQSRNATGVWPACSGNNSCSSGPIAGSPIERPSHPALFRAGLAGESSRQGGMLSSHPIGAATKPLIPMGSLGPTHLYTRPRVLQGHAALINATRSTFSISASCQPCIKWTRRDPNTPASSSLPPHPLLATARPLRRKHLRTMKEPVARTASPYTDPTVKGPRSQQLHSGHLSQARKSTSPSSATAVLHSISLCTSSSEPTFSGPHR